MYNGTKLSAGIAGTMFFLLVWFAATTSLEADTHVKTRDGDTPVPVVAIDNVCAWPNLTVLDDGTIVATIFNKPHHGGAPGDVECWTSADEGQHWSKAGTPAQHDPNTARMNVAAGKAHNGDMLVIASGWDFAANPDAILAPWLCRSSDGGTTWTVDKTAVPSMAPDGYPLIPYGDIVEGDDGVLRAAFYAWRGRNPRGEHTFIMQSRDDGQTWEEECIPLDENNIRNETALLNLGGNNWLAATRTGGEASSILATMYLYGSIDNGETWQSRGQVTGSREHPGHFLRMQDGRILLTYGDRAGSCGVEAIVSSDEGMTWSDSLRVMDWSSSDGGYPSSVQLPDGQILTAYYAAAITGHNRYHMGVVTWDPAMSFPVPEPSAIVLLTCGGLALVVIRQRRLGFRR